jgi:hypothetical protein
MTLHGGLIRQQPVRKRELGVVLADRFQLHGHDTTVWLSGICGPRELDQVRTFEPQVFAALRILAAESVHRDLVAAANARVDFRLCTATDDRHHPLGEAGGVGPGVVNLIGGGGEFSF